MQATKVYICIIRDSYVRPGEESAEATMGSNMGLDTSIYCVRFGKAGTKCMQKAGSEDTCDKMSEIRVGRLQPLAQLKQNHESIPFLTVRSNKHFLSRRRSSSVVNKPRRRGFHCVSS